LTSLPSFDSQEAMAIGERIRSAKAHAFSTIGAGQITATIGVSNYPDCPKWEDLKVTADRLAMKAKKQGKDRVAHSQATSKASLSPGLDCTGSRVVRLPIDENNIIGSETLQGDSLEPRGEEFEVALARIDYQPAVGKIHILEVRVQAIYLRA
jgi:hypothetical protein